MRPQGTGYCHTCKQRVPIKWEDIGIGAYEFWGAKGTDVNWIAVCPECGDDLSETVTNCDERSDYEKDEINGLYVFIIINKSYGRSKG
jgi:hypothetical protein